MPKQWRDAYYKIKPYVIRVSTPRGAGTGFLFAYAVERAYCGFATAAHVIKEAHEWGEPIKLEHHATGKSVLLPADKRHVFVDEDKDSAAIVIKHPEFGLPDKLLRVMPVSRRQEVGDPVGWVGFPSVAPAHLCFFSGHVSAVLADEDAYLIDGVAIHGVSGGPVYCILKNYQLRLLGTVCAYVPNRATDAILPGVLRVQGLSSFHPIIEGLKNAQVVETE